MGCTPSGTTQCLSETNWSAICGPRTLTSTCVLDQHRTRTCWDGKTNTEPIEMPCKKETWLIRGWLYLSISPVFFLRCQNVGQNLAKNTNQLPRARRFARGYLVRLRTRVRDASTIREFRGWVTKDEWIIRGWVNSISIRIYIYICQELVPPRITEASPFFASGNRDDLCHLLFLGKNNSRVGCFSDPAGGYIMVYLKTDTNMFLHAS